VTRDLVHWPHLPPGARFQAWSWGQVRTHFMVRRTVFDSPRFKLSRNPAKLNPPSFPSGAAQRLAIRHQNGSVSNLPPPAPTCPRSRRGTCPPPPALLRAGAGCQSTFSSVFGSLADDRQRDARGTPLKRIPLRARASWPRRPCWEHPLALATGGSTLTEGLRRRQRLGGPLPCRHGAHPSVGERSTS
jgi:hypothetical protein